MPPSAFYPGTAPHFLGALPPGVEGTRATLRLMTKLTRTGKVDPGVRQLAQRLTRALPHKDFAGEIRALHRFVRDCIRYVGDVRGIETVQTPRRTLETGSGDCDDKATLLAALLESIGYSTRFWALGFNGGDFSHVLAEVRLGTRWIPLETIIPGKEAGWAPPNPTRQQRAHV